MKLALQYNPISHPPSLISVYPHPYAVKKAQPDPFKRSLNPATKSPHSHKATREAQRAKHGPNIRNPQTTVHFSLNSLNRSSLVATLRADRGSTRSFKNPNETAKNAKAAKRRIVLRGSQSVSPRSPSSAASMRPPPIPESPPRLPKSRPGAKGRAASPRPPHPPSFRITINHPTAVIRLPSSESLSKLPKNPLQKIRGRIQKASA